MEKEITVQEICTTTTQKWIKEDSILVDVREKDEIETLAYDVPKLMHIPLSEFEKRYQEIPKDQKVVVVCRSGARSLRAAAYMIFQGYDPSKVVNMKNGIIGWAEKDYPVKGDKDSVLYNSESNCSSTSNCC